MNFLYPEFLYALAVLAIPVVIHLFSFKRYKKLYFPDISFLKQVQTAARTKNKLKHWLILLSRLAFLAFLVIAFAQPYFEQDKTAGSDLKRLHVFFIDNSMSMSVESNEGEGFNYALQLADEISERFPADHKFMLIPTSGFVPKIFTKEDFTDELTRVQKTFKQTAFTQLFSAFKHYISSTEYDGAYDVYFMSDFQKTTVGLEKFKNDSTPVTLIKIPLLPVSNLAVDSIWSASPVHALNTIDRFYFSVKNFGNEAAENVVVQAKIKNALVLPATINVAAGDTTVVSFSYENTEFGNYAGQIEVEDYPLTFDNRYYFAYNVSDKINVVELGESKPNDYLFTLFSSDSLFNYSFQPVLNVAFNKIQTADLLILNGINSLSSGLRQLITDFVKKGGSLVVIPPKNDTQDLNEFLQQINGIKYLKSDTSMQYISEVDYNDVLFQNVFVKTQKPLNLPWVKGFRQVKSINYYQTVIRLRNEAPFLLRSVFENGNVYCFTSQIDEKTSNFGRHSLFVPVFYNLALQSAPHYNLAFNLNTPSIQLPYRFEIEKTRLVAADSSEIIPRLKNQGKFTVLYSESIEKPGVYTLKDDSLNLMIAFNSLSEESKMSFYSNEEIEKLLTENNLKNTAFYEAASNINVNDWVKSSAESKLWKWFILLALLMFLAEIIIIKFL